MSKSPTDGQALQVRLKSFSPDPARILKSQSAHIHTQLCRFLSLRFFSIFRLQGIKPG